MQQQRNVPHVIAFSLLGTGVIWCWWRIRALGDVRLHLGAFYGFFAAAFLCYLGALWLIRREERTGTRQRVHAASLGLILLIAACARLILLGATPTLSDDIYRYRWDGRVQRAGIGPYTYPPDDPVLAFLRDEPSTHVNFPHLRTIYPPFTELAFRVGVSLGDTLAAQKVVFVCAESLTVMSVLFILWRRGRTPLWVAAYAWHPLAILEIAGSGHNDALGIAALWIGLATWQGRWWLGCTLAWVAAFLSKFVSLSLVPWWWFRAQARGWLAVFLSLSALAFVWHPDLATAFVESLSWMSHRNGSNASIYPALAALLGHAKIALLVAFGIWGGFLVWWARRSDDPMRYLFGALTAAALLGPALHPWYLVWLIPFFCFWRVPAFVLLTGTVVLSYAVWPGYLASSAWKLPVWAHVLEYAPVLLLGALQVYRTISSKYSLHLHAIVRHAR